MGDDPKWGPFIAAIERGKVILTNDDLAEDGQPVRRTSYVASYRVQHVQVIGPHLTFESIERLDNFS